MPHTQHFQSGASTQILTLDGGDLVWCAGADTHLIASSRLQGSAGFGAARLAEGGGLPTKVSLVDGRIKAHDGSSLQEIAESWFRSNAHHHLTASSRLQASAGFQAARLAEGGGLPTKVRA